MSTEPATGPPLSMPREEARFASPAPAPLAGSSPPAIFQGFWEGADYFVPEFFQELQRSRAVLFWTSCATG